MKTSLVHTCRFAAVALLPWLWIGWAANSQAGALQSLFNPVQDGAINTTASNNDRTDWAVVTPFAADLDEGRGTDYQQVFWAHDSTNFYLRYLTFRTTAGNFLSYQQKALLDTDQSRATGYHGNFLSLGAEYLLEGSSLYRFTGAAPDQWGWAFVGSLVYDDWPLNDQELTLPRALLGSPAAVNFFLLAESDGPDYYPDTAPAPAGDYFTYNTTRPALRLRLEGTPPSFFWLTGNGPDGTYIVESSPDLKTWTAIATNETVNGEFLCVPPADGATQQFFRAIQQ